MAQFDPFREIDRFFNAASRGSAALGMPMDLIRTDDAFIARIDLPGVDPSTIDIDFEERTLTIRAERTTETAEGDQWLSRERPTGTFARQLTLGYGVAYDKIEADYADGVLTVTIPVAESAKPRKVSVSHTSSKQVVDAEPEDDADEKKSDKKDK